MEVGKMIKPALTFVATALVVAAAFFGYKKYGAWQDARVIKWKADSSRVADDTKAAVVLAIKKDTIYLRAATSYLARRNSILASGTATARDSATFKACDEVRLTCDERHVADTLVAYHLREELRIARAKPSERQKRFMFYGEGLYDLLHAVPVFRAGTELRLFGEIRAIGVGDLAIPSARECGVSGKCSVTTRALVGIKYIF